MDIEELNSWIKDMKSDISNVIERIEDNTMPDKDYEMLGNMILQLDHEVRNSPEYHADTGISAPAVSVILNELYDALNARNTTLLQINHDMLNQVILFGDVIVTKEDYESMEKYQPREDGRTYIDFLPQMPHKQYLQVVEHLKSIGARFDPEMKQWYVDAEWEPAQQNEKEILKQEEESETMDEQKLIDAERNEIEKESNIMSKENDETTNYEEKFRAIYYEGSERKELFAETKENAIASVKELKQGIKDNDRCYIQELNPETGKYQQEGIYLINSGRDVTPVEIKLPYMSSESFDEVKKGIKEMGAKFSGESKMWYVERSASEETLKGIQDIINSHDENTYLKLPYMSSETYKEVRGEIKEMGAKYNGDKRMWYVNFDAPKETVDNIRNYVDSHDEATYLQLPPANKEQFSKMVQQLKDDGARFNPDKKAWYITDKQDKSKFAPYLQSEKPSVLDKLKQNKDSVDKSNHEKERTMEPRNKDYERA